MRKGCITDRLTSSGWRKWMVQTACLSETIKGISAFQNSVMFLASSHTFQITYLDQNCMLNSSLKNDIVEYYYLYHLSRWKRLTHSLLLTLLLSTGLIRSNGIVLKLNVDYYRKVNHTGTGVWFSGFKPQLFSFLLAAWPWARYFTFLRFSFLICKMIIAFS